MASISVDAMRDKIADVYPGEGWKYRVRNLMPVNQVIAVYANFLRLGKFDEKKQTKKDICKTNEKSSEDEYRQLTLWEFGMQYGGD